MRYDYGTTEKKLIIKASCLLIVLLSASIIVVTIPWTIQHSEALHTGVLQPSSYSGIDTYVNSSLPNVNYGSEGILDIWACTPVGLAPTFLRTYLKIDFSHVTIAGTITSVTISLYNTGGGKGIDGTQKILIKRVIEPWDEGSLTWETQPLTDIEIGAFIIDEIIVDTAGWINIELNTDAVQSWIADPENNYGMVLLFENESTISDTRIVFASSDTDLGAEYRPKFTITFTNTPPDQPELWHPYDESWLNDNMPYFSWMFTDPDSWAGDAQTAFVLELSSDSEFATVEYNTGTIETSDGWWNWALPEVLPDGYWYWRVKVRDSENAWSAYSIPNMFGLDTVKPTVSVVTPANNSWLNNPSPTFEWTAEDDFSGLYGTYRIVIDNSTPLTEPYIYEDWFEGNTTNNGKTSWELPKPFEEGVYYWYVYTHDIAGNWGPVDPYVEVEEPITPNYWKFMVDLTSPEGMPIAPLENVWTNATPIFKWYAWDNFSGLSGNYTLTVATYQEAEDDTMLFLQYTFVGSTISYSPQNVTLPVQLDEGTYIWCVGFEDNATNWGVMPRSLFSVDATPPSVTLILPQPAAWLNTTTPTFSWYATDPSPGAGLSGRYHIQLAHDFAFTELALDIIIEGSTINGNTTSYTLPVTYALNSSVYYWRVRAEDNVGNWGKFSSPRLLGIDTEPPTITLLTPPAGAWLNTCKPTFEWYASDTLAGLNGTYRLVIEPVDTEQTPIIIDIVGSTINEYINSYTIDVPLAPGTYQWYIEASDNTANYGSTSSSDLRVFGIDLNPPEITLLTPANQTWVNNAMPNFSWRCIEDLSPPTGVYKLQIAEDYEFKLIIRDITVYYTWPDRTNIFDVETYYQLQDFESLPEGTYYWRVSTEDCATNLGMSDTFRFQIDVTSVVYTDATPTTAQETSVVTCSIVLNDMWSGVDVDSIAYQYTTTGLEHYCAWTKLSESLNASMVVAEDNCKSVYCTVTLTFANGTDNYIRWRARDRAGNPYSISDDYQIIVSIPPINEPPDAPKVFSHIETIDTTPLFKWVKGIDPDGDMVYTYIQVGTEPGTYDIIANYTTTGTSITLPELERGRTYYIELWAVDTHNATSPHVQVQLDVLYLPVTISEVLFSDQKLTAGNPVDIYAVIQNQYSTGFNITVYFYDGKPATANDSVLIIGKKTEWLSANGTVSVIVTWQNPTPGNHEIYVIVSNSTPDSEYVKAVTVYEKAGKDEQPPPGTFLPGGFFGLLLLIALIVAIVIIAAAFIIAYRRKRQKEEAPEEKLPPLPPPSPPAKLPEKKAAEAVKPKPPAKPPVAVAKEKAYVTRYEELKEPKQCNICLGTIKPGLIYAACGKCGKIYHESCATRVRKCPRCDAKFTPKPPSLEIPKKPPVVREKYKDIAWVAPEPSRAPETPGKPDEEEVVDETVTWE